MTVEVLGIFVITISLGILCVAGEIHYRRKKRREKSMKEFRKFIKRLEQAVMVDLPLEKDGQKDGTGVTIRSCKAVLVEIAEEQAARADKLEKALVAIRPLAYQMNDHINNQNINELWRLVIKIQKLVTGALEKEVKK